MKFQSSKNKTVLFLLVGLFSFTYSQLGNAAGDNAVFYAHPTPYLSDNDLPERAAPLVELGNSFLGPGKKITEGFILPTGAVWNPSLWVFGGFRTALQTSKTGAATQAVSELATRLDLFANLQLSATERLVVGMRPLDRSGRFTSYIFGPDRLSGFQDGLNANLTTFFFEGDIGQIFPRWQQRRKGGGDIGFSVGRQSLFLQEGLLINDVVDMVGVTQNSLSGGSIINFQIMSYFGFNQINRNDNQRDHDAKLYGVHIAMDTFNHTINFDVVYVDSTYGIDEPGDLLVFAASSVQRIGHWTTAWRALVSQAMDNNHSLRADDGVLLFAENSIIPHGTHDIFYVNGAAAFGQFTSAARGPTTGGPLGRTGILFASPVIGSVGAAISNRTDDVVALAMGYQKFFTRDLQATLEVGGRIGLDDDIANVLGVAARLQYGVGRRVVLLADIFAADSENRKPNYGARGQLLVKF